MAELIWGFIIGAGIIIWLSRDDKRHEDED